MKNTKKLLPLALASLSVLALSGCGSSGGSLDSSKTQLYVKNYQGGYGNKWLYNAASKFETLHANDSFESGKKGVQIIIDDQKSAPTSADIRNGTHQVYFFEGVFYTNLHNDGVLADITDVLTEPNSYDGGKTILSKFSDQQKSFYGIEENGTTHYYGIPHYMATFGIVYNKKVFDEGLYYFRDGYESMTGDARFVLSESDKKSAGADGVYGTADDGLPLTYDDFFALCEYIKAGDDVPLNWMGKNSFNYLGSLMNALEADYDGMTQNMVNYTNDGAMEVAKMNFNGSGDATSVVLGSDGLPETETVNVLPGKESGKYNGYENTRSMGKYYALNFMRRLIDVSGEYAYSKALNDSYTHLDAQENFINGTFGNLPAPYKGKHIAMLFEGNWWESEASTALAALSDTERSQLDFGWMPLPKAYASKQGEKYTSFNSLNSMCFVKSGLNDDMNALAKDFVRYMNTDESLVDFTLKTNAIKALKYTVSDDNLAQVSKFGQSFYSYVQKSDVFSPDSQDYQYSKTIYSSTMQRRYSTSAAQTYPSSVFRTNASMTADDYLVSMYNYYKNDVWGVLNH